MGHPPPVSGDRGKSKVISPFVSPAAARVEDEEAVAPEEGHGHSAGEAEFLGHLEDSRAWTAEDGPLLQG